MNPLHVPFGGGIAVSLLAEEGRYSLQSGALPDGDHFVFMLGHPAEDKRGIYVASLTKRDQPKRLLADASPVTYVPWASRASGSLVFARGGAIIAQPFNPARLELSGEPSRLVEDADVTLGATFQSSVPRTLFRAPVFSGGATVSNHY